MKTSKGGHDAAEERTKLMRAIHARDEKMQEAAALLLLLGNDLSRCHEQGAGNWADKRFGEFISCGLIGISIKAAQNLHQATLTP